MDVRVAAAEVIAEVLRGRSLSPLLPSYVLKVNPNDQALLKELCFGTLRWYPQIEIILNHLIDKPLKRKELPLQSLMACGIYQLLYMRIAEHAVINETVASTTKLNRQWAKGFVNGVLRTFQRQKQQLLQHYQQNPIFRSAHPAWLVNALQTCWPDAAEQIMANNNQQAPMTLRVNGLQVDRGDYLQRLAEAGIAARTTEYSAQGIVLDSPMDVSDLPGFEQGLVSVQDEAAQLAAPLLNLAIGQRVLDACCAPGGKTCHILESQPDLQQVVAIDMDKERLKRSEDNLKRLDLSAQLITADVGDTEKWWDSVQFDRILLDAPCSASGVIRRHPDIKLLRKGADIDKLAIIQSCLLNKVWKTLADGGILVYATCSVLQRENDQVVQQFLADHTDASIMPIEAHWGQATDCGRQLFPTVDGSDGFYYSRLLKGG
jgi:16S rRNA (cytosine967-C5)-methyltransferase